MTGMDPSQQKASPQESARLGDRLPTGRHRLSREEVAASQRQRLLDAMAELCSTKGYHATTIAEIVASAGVSRATYYELFKDKEDCFLATIEEALRRLQSAVLPVALRDEQDRWADRVPEVVEALLRFLAEEPAYSKTAIIEALACGERAFELYTAGASMVAALIDQGREAASPDAQLPKRTARIVLGAGEWLVTSEMIAGRTERVTELAPDFVYIAVLPFLGQEEALRRMGELARSPRGPRARA